MLCGKCLCLAVPLIVACGLLACAGAAQAQDSQTQQTQSVADAARHAREEKKTAAKPSKVITDDDLNKTPKSGAEGGNAAAAPAPDAQPASPAAAGVAEAPDQTAASPGEGTAKKAGENAEITRVKEQIAELKKKLDLSQRELALDQDTYYSNTDYAHDTAGQTKLATEQQQINDQHERLEELKTRLAALIELEDRKKKSAGDEAAPAQPQP